MLTHFPIHTIATAPEESRPALEQLQKEVGFLPNLAATMAESPAMLRAFTTLRSIYAGTSFTGVEREVIALTTSFENRCTYCVAAHSTFAAMQRAPEGVIETLRAGGLPDDAPRLAALSAITRRLIETRGFVSEADLRSFAAAGFGRAQVLEALVGIATTSLANYMHNIGDCPLDAMFQARAWIAPSAAPVS